MPHEGSQWPSHNRFSSPALPHPRPAGPHHGVEEGERDLGQPHRVHAPPHRLPAPGRQHEGRRAELESGTCRSRESKRASCGKDYPPLPNNNLHKRRICFLVSIIVASSKTPWARDSTGPIPPARRRGRARRGAARRGHAVASARAPARPGPAGDLRVLPKRIALVSFLCRLH